MKRLLILFALTAWWAVPAMAAQFDHAAHLEYIEGMPCTTCHVEGGEQITPPQSACLECHDQEFVDEVAYPGLKTHGPVWTLDHRPFAKMSDYDCAACHSQQDCLECHQSRPADEFGEWGNNMINVHRSDFHVTHPIAARTNPQLCSSCHENQFCVECHQSFAPADLAVLSHRQGFRMIEAGPTPHSQFGDHECQNCHTDSVLPSHEWSSQHAREARKNLASCQSCHPQGDVCLTCHSARTGLMVSPHPKGWDDIKGRLDRASDGKTCRKCH